MADRKLKLTEWAPSEHEEQSVVVEWAGEMVRWKKYPELAGLFAIPNGVKYSGDYRNRAQWAAKMRAEGLRAGFPDLCLPIARRGFNSLFIEMKSLRKGAVETEEQVEWIRWLNDHGNHAVVCKGAKVAIEKLLWYVGYGNG